LKEKTTAQLNTSSANLKPLRPVIFFRSLLEPLPFTSFDPQD
jgi:hypothetical protein